MTGLIRVGQWYVIWLVVLGLVACARAPIVKQELITVTGRGYAKDFTEPAPEPPSRYINNLWAKLSLEARGTAKPQAMIANPLQRKLIAQLRARSNAKRALAQKVEELKITDDVTLGEYLQTHPGLRPQVEDLIRNANLAQEEELADGSWSVLVELKLAGLAEMIGPQALSELSKPRQTPPQTIREKAEAQAIRNARERLMRYIGGLQTQSGMTVSELMRRNPRFSQYMQALVQNAPIVDTRYPEDGVSEVDLEFDLAAIRELLSEVF